MVNMFLNAITEALHAEFGEGYEIHTEDVPQGLVPPCFLISMISSNRDKQTHVTYRQAVLFAVQYFPSSEDNYRNEIHQVIGRLDECLETIDVTWAEKKTKETRVYTTDVSITDQGVLSYIIRVEDVYFRTESGDLMESIEPAGIEVRNG